jgi:hypothetical protein
MGNKNEYGVNQNGWNEYSKLVLAELERLNENDERIQKTLNEINEKLVRYEAIRISLENVNQWKDEMDKVATPEILKEMKVDVKSNTNFKVIATTVWAVIQIGFGAAIAIFK